MQREEKEGVIVSLSFSPLLEDLDLGVSSPTLSPPARWRAGLALSLWAHVSSSEALFATCLTTTLGRSASRGSPGPPQDHAQGRKCNEKIES
jgi:hypothetical protein